MLSRLKLVAVQTARSATLLLASLGLGLTWTGAAVTAGSLSLLAPRHAVAAQDDKKDKQDIIIFRSGQQVQGEILEETPTAYRVRVVVAGIAAETTYNKADILSVMRGEGDPIPGRPAAKAPAPTTTTRAAASPGAPGRKKVYVLELTGIFGEDISQTPIRRAVADAQRHGVDYLLVVIDNDWSLRRMGLEIDLPEDETEFNKLSRAADMEIIFREEIPQTWENPPKIVFWVKNAMGGAAFLPLSTGEIYFHSEAKMGGIGHLTRMLGSQGDEVVRQKMYSAMISQATGLAIAGGYDPRIVRAMAWTEYVLSVRFEGGRPVFIEGFPERDGDILLTDDGKDDNKDTIEALARGEGNDVLTLKADMALKLGISKGTADSIHDLMFLLGIGRNHEIVSGQADRIMRTWRTDVDEAKRNLRRMWEREFREIRVQGDYRERSQARGRQIQLIERMQAIIRRFEEAFDPRSLGVPDWNTLNILKEQIRLEQLGDRR